MADISETIEKGCSSNKKSQGCGLNTCGLIDDECGCMEIYCWPFGPRPFAGPCKYSRSNLCNIPSFSLYFAWRDGPLSKLSARVTGSPFDLIGFVIQSKANGGGTYVYLVNNQYNEDTSKIPNKVTTVPLTDLITDPSIRYHAVLPLKDFEDCRHVCKQHGPYPHTFFDERLHGDAYRATQGWAEAFNAGQREAICCRRHNVAGCAECGDYANTKGHHHHRRRDCCDCSSEITVSESGTSYSPDSVSSCWKSRSSGYSCPCPSSSSSGSSCSSSSSCSDDCFAKTHNPKKYAHELQAERTKVMKRLLIKYADMKPEYDAYQNMASIFGLPVAEELRTKNAFTGPELVGLILFQAGLIWDARFSTDGRNPLCCLDREFYQSLTQRASERKPHEAIVMLCSPATHAKLSDCAVVDECKVEEALPNLCQEGVCCDNVDREPENLSPSVNGNLREFLNDAYSQGFACRVGALDEKGDSGSVLENGSRTDGNYGFERFYGKPQRGEPVIVQNELSQPDAICPEECESCCFRKIKKRRAHARTIMFGSLRVVDFLKDYYAAKGIDPNGYGNVIEDDCLSGYGFSSDVVAAINDLAKERIAGSRLGYQLNDLDLVWFHDNLIPIELCPDEGLILTCREREQQECGLLANLACQIRRDFLQQVMLNQDISGLSGFNLRKICARYSELASEVHCLAEQAGVRIRLKDKCCRPCDASYEFDSDSCEGGSYRFKVNLSQSGANSNGEFALVSEPYMWGSEWSYDCEQDLDCDEDKWCHLHCLIQRSVANLKDLRSRIPKNCIVLELVHTLLREAHRLLCWINRCKNRCCNRKWSRHQKRHRRSKGVEVKVEEVVSEITEQA